MEIEKVKIRDKKTGAIQEVKKSLVSDFLGTGKYELATEKKIVKEEYPESEDFSERPKYAKNRYGYIKFREVR